MENPRRFHLKNLSIDSFSTFCFINQNEMSVATEIDT